MKTIKIGKVSIGFVSIPNIPFRKTLKDFLSWNKWVVNGWVQRHLPCALIGSVGLFFLLRNVPKWEAIFLGSVIGWFVSYIFEFWQKWQITAKNPNHKTTEKEALESAKDWVATTIFFIIFITALNLFFR